MDAAGGGPYILLLILDIYGRENPPPDPARLPFRRGINPGNTLPRFILWNEPSKGMFLSVLIHLDFRSVYDYDYKAKIKNMFVK